MPAPTDNNNISLFFRRNVKNLAGGIADFGTCPNLCYVPACGPFPCLSQDIRRQALEDVANTRVFGQAQTFEIFIEVGWTHVNENELRTEGSRQCCT
jgi:hypothetical protein